MELKLSGGFLFFVFLTLVTLKLLDVITWSWWFVTLPLWGGFAIWIIGLAFVLCMAALYVVLRKIEERL